MESSYHSEIADDIVGADRDAERIAQSLRSGTSIVLVGTLGSGKSHLVRDVAAKLRILGIDPLVIRSGGPLASDPSGALDSAHDPRAQLLRDGRAGDGPPPIVIVDDGQELDDESAAAIAKAVYGGHACALFALTVTRDGSAPRAEAGAAASGLAVELWLRGLADRIDLNELTTPDADDLLAHFDGNTFDAITRASVIGLADGSRMLLRELAREAATAIAQGRDPLTAIRDTPPRGRLSDALAAHVAQLSDPQRTALAALGRVPRIAFADATRIASIEAVEELIRARLVYDDGTPERLLTANAALAREADRASGHTPIDDLLHRAMSRMLQDESDWWSAPLARRIALAWHRGESTAPAAEGVSPAMRVRVCLDAARLANDAGDAELAAAYARHGLRAVDDIGLRLELAYAEAARGAAVDVNALVAALGAADADADTVLRWLSLGSVLLDRPVAPTGDPSSGDLFRADVHDAEAVAEIALARAHMHGLALEWRDTLAEAEELSTRPATSASFRMRAAAMAGLAQACLGDSSEAHKWFLRAQRLIGEREISTSVTTVERLWAISVEILAHGMAGTDARTALARLDEECTAAALEGDPATGALAGLVVATAYASVGDVARAALELRAAVRRARPATLASWVAFVEILVARALALTGRPVEAREILDMTDTAVVDPIPLLAHARLETESCVLSAEGRSSDAIAAARAASRAAEDTPTLHARDLYQLIALGEQAEEILPALRRIAETTSVPSARVLTDRASELVSARTTDGPIPAFEAVRMGAVWGIGDGEREWARRAPTPGRAPGMLWVGESTHRESVLDLTRREREIALLVSEGLSNREIATRLYLSVRTVESHIYQARAKVDARTRGDLGRLVEQTRRTLRGTR